MIHKQEVHLETYIVMSRQVKLRKINKVGGPPREVYANLQTKLEKGEMG